MFHVFAFSLLSLTVAVIEALAAQRALACQLPEGAPAWLCVQSLAGTLAILLHAGRGYSSELTLRVRASLAASPGLRDLLAEDSSRRSLAVLRDSAADPASWVGSCSVEQDAASTAATMEAVRVSIFLSWLPVPPAAYRPTCVGSLFHFWEPLMSH